MYIKKVKISHIRAINQLTLTFDKPAGWHVLIGDNGAGKSTIVRSIALALLNQVDINATREDWDDWLSQDKKEGSIQLDVLADKKYDQGLISDEDGVIKNKIVFERYYKPTESDTDEITLSEQKKEEDIWDVRVVGVSGVRIKELKFGNQTVLGADATATNLDLRKGWFAAAYGPFRRFTGGSPEKEKVYKSNPYLGAVLSVFGEDVALSEALTYIRELFIRELYTHNPKNTSELSTVDYLKKFMNEAELLPHQVTIDEINANVILFKDANGRRISTLQMSDGFRSVLSLTLELIRQLIAVYNPKRVFDDVIKGGKTIDLPGVVLIDEVDAHLHPTWQTKIGKWFTDHFPNIQFIVTTHSPLICRAAEKGTIWHLPTPGSGETLQEITGVKRKRLIFGNVLDAYGTGVFGEKTAISEDSNDKRNELAELNVKSMLGQISEPEEQQLNELRSIFPTKG